MGPLLARRQWEDGDRVGFSRFGLSGFMMKAEIACI